MENVVKIKNILNLLLKNVFQFINTEIVNKHLLINPKIVKFVKMVIMQVLMDFVYKKVKKQMMFMELLVIYKLQIVLK